MLGYTFNLIRTYSFHYALWVETEKEVINRLKLRALEPGVVPALAAWHRQRR